MKEINVGIDLGTTYSAVAVFDGNGGKVDILKNHLEEETTPSVVYIENGETLIGVEAKNEQASGNQNVAAFYKSYMGDETQRPYLNGREYTAEELSGIFLSKLKESIEEANGVRIKGAVITVPAYFNESQRQATIRAGEAAGLKVLKIINEPTAAIIAYGLTGQGKRNVMVYDLGGGTFDVTIAEINGTNVNVLATNGNHQLGGKDWDRTIVDYIIEQFNNDYEIDINDYPEELNELIVKCEKAKKQLTNMPSTQISVSCEGNTGRYTVTREQFDDFTLPYLNETLTLSENCFREIGKGFGWKNIDEVVLVGGSTRMPQVSALITRVFGKEPKIIGNKVDTIVATGAAMQASLCTEGKITLSLQNFGVKTVRNGGNAPATLTLSNDDIKDVTAHGLGILATDKPKDGKVRIINSVILAKNSKIGVPEQKEYHTTADTTEVYVLQGELENPFECTLLDKYTVSGLRGGQMNDFYIVFLYNQNGVVEVTAKYTDGKPLAVKRERCAESLEDICRRLEEDYERIMNTPYTQWAGVSNIPSTSKDKYGNPRGGEYDLAKDGAFTGYKIVVLNLCDECTFDQPEKALKKKGFIIKEYQYYMPPAAELERELLDDKSQLWIISDKNSYMLYDHVKVIKKYFLSGHGVYIWGDNDPFYQDANTILDELFGVEMYGNEWGDKVISIQKSRGDSGIIADHPITTGIVNFYEGITIATVETKNKLKPLVYGSARNIVTAYYDENGMRALVDGGFTRLFCNWDSAGTDRYVVNAAAWLANVEHFGYKSLGK